MTGDTVMEDTSDTYEFTAILDRWTSASHGTMHWVSVPAPIAQVLDGVALMRRLETGRRAGFGSVKLTMRIGSSRWSTSAFPLRERGWSIPVSAKVRKAHELVSGEPVEVAITV
jgi:hypothetical protein